MTISNNDNSNGSNTDQTNSNNDKNNKKDETLPSSSATGSTSAGYNFQQGLMSAGASAASAAAAAAQQAANSNNDTTTMPTQVPSDPNSIQSILANNMPKHLMDRSTNDPGSSMPMGGMVTGGQEGGPGDDNPMGAVAAAAAANQHHPVAEFLYQLTKMLTDDNSEIIEWTDGRIKVHYPERLEDEVLHKYFRHSKFASFQRQLNYFGFRKIAGKGKMSPCSYVNESATGDIRSLLLIKRKTNGSAARKAMAQRAASLQMNGLGGVNGLGVNGMPGMANPALGTGLPGLAGLSLQLQMQKQLGVNMNQGAFQSGGGSGLGLDFSGGSGPGIGGGNSANQLSQLLLQNHAGGGMGRHSFADLQQLGFSSGAPGGNNQAPPRAAIATLEQLQAQLAELQSQAAAAGTDNAASAALNAAALNLAQASGGFNQLWSGGPASAAANTSSSGGAGGNDNPATAALNASAALDNPASQSQIANMNSLFESATNLKALIGNESSDAKTASNALSGLPSTGGFASNVSLGNLLNSNARLSSLLSLNSFLSREPSLADLAMMQPNARNNNVNQYAAFQQHVAQQQQQQMNMGGGAPASS